MAAADVIEVDEQDRELGSIPRKLAHEEGRLHRVVNIYLTNDKGEILVQKRVDGFLDHSVGGHVDSGDTYESAALRELEEEVGVSGAKLTEIGRGMTNEFGGKIRHMFKLFVCTAEPKRLQPEEVAGVYWADPHAVWADMQKDLEGKKYIGGFRASLELYLKHSS